MHLSWIDFLVMGGFFSFLAWMGCHFSARNTSTEEYFLGGRSFPSWAIGISMVGTIISSITFLAIPADAYKTTWLRFLIQFGMIPAVVIAVYLAIPFYRRTRMTTAYEYLGMRFGPGIQVYGAVVLIHTETKTLQDAAQILNSLVGGGLVSIFMVGFLTRVGDSRAVGIGIGCTMLFTAWTILAQYQMLPDWLGAPFDLYYTTIVGNLLMFVCVLLVGPLLPRAKRDLTNLTVWDQNRISPPGDAQVPECPSDGKDLEVSGS